MHTAPGQVPDEEESRHLSSAHCIGHSELQVSAGSRAWEADTTFYWTEMQHHVAEVLYVDWAMFTIYRYVGHMTGNMLTKCGGRKKRDVPNRGSVERH